MARKPSALARELLRNFPKGKRRRKRRARNGSENARQAAAESRAGTSASQDGATAEDIVDVEPEPAEEATSKDGTAGGP
jgi:hypothetical protein